MHSSWRIPWLGGRTHRCRLARLDRACSVVSSTHFNSMRILDPLTFRVRRLLAPRRFADTVINSVLVEMILLGVLWLLFLGQLSYSSPYRGPYFADDENGHQAEQPLSATVGRASFALEETRSVERPGLSKPLLGSHGSRFPPCWHLRSSQLSFRGASLSHSRWSAVDQPLPPTRPV